MRRQVALCLVLVVNCMYGLPLDLESPEDEPALVKCVGSNGQSYLKGDLWVDVVDGVDNICRCLPYYTRRIDVFSPLELPRHLRTRLTKLCFLDGCSRGDRVFPPYTEIVAHDGCISKCIPGTDPVDNMRAQYSTFHFKETSMCNH
ncbi:unnamed protein product [Owenia fusiformis]|uniref:Secreted protein n=1 Tax=Owenia fusiformis TaxID=6347 RepID=A0A8S4NDN2_OWEFU|nr:unnamed protein product [Owenia fusiformis]